MTGISEMTAMYENFIKALPFDNKLFEDTYKNNSTLNEKFAEVMISAAAKNTDVTSKWAKDTLTKMSGLAQSKTDAADYAKTITDFASDQVEAATESMAAFAEIAKRTQMDFVEIMMTVGKDISEEATASVKQAKADVGSTEKKSTVK